MSELFFMDLTLNFATSPMVTNALALSTRREDPKASASQSFLLSAEPFTVTPSLVSFN